MLALGLCVSLVAAAWTGPYVELYGEALDQYTCIATPPGRENRSALSFTSEIEWVPPRVTCSYTSAGRVVATVERTIEYDTTRFASSLVLAGLFAFALAGRGVLAAARRRG